MDTKQINWEIAVEVHFIYKVNFHHLASNNCVMDNNCTDLGEASKSVGRLQRSVELFIPQL